MNTEYWTLEIGYQRFSQINSGTTEHVSFEPMIDKIVKSHKIDGTVLFFAGASEGATIPTTINDLFWRTEITLTSSYGGSPQDCNMALKLLESGSLPVDRLVTHRLAMSEGLKGFEAVSTPMDHNCVKVILDPQK